MAGIFISYRRDDTAGYAGRIYDQLREDVPDAPIFMDVDSVGPGDDFTQQIESALQAADVFLAVVGRNWVTATDSRGQRRLDNPVDFVRLEVAAALQRTDVRVIPVLVGGAVMPAPEELPDELAALSRRNALTLSDVDWRPGITKLVAAVRQTLGTPPPVRPDRGPKDTDAREAGGENATVLVGLAGAALLVLATVLRWDVLVHPDFGGGTVPNLGVAFAPASIVVALGALYALLKAWRSGAGALATGLLLGFAVGGFAKYAALLGQDDPDRLGSSGSLVLGLAGSAVLGGVATFWLVTRHLETQRPPRLLGRLLAAAGAVLIAAATFIPFNVSSDASGETTRELSGWEAFEPLALAAVIVLAVFLGSATKQLVVSGVFVALGLVGAFFWLRYVGVPLLQMLHEDDLASVRPGGFVGLAGSALVWAAGLVGRDPTVT